MADLTYPLSRAYGNPKLVGKAGVAADVEIVAGMALAKDAAGNVTPLAGATGEFAGFAAQSYDSTGKAAGFGQIDVVNQGTVDVVVVGSGSTAQGVAVYATDSNTFTVVNTGANKIGGLSRQISGTKWEIFFQTSTLQGASAPDDGV